MLRADSGPPTLTLPHQVCVILPSPGNCVTDGAGSPGLSQGQEKDKEGKILPLPRAW